MSVRGHQRPQDQAYRAALGIPNGKLPTAIGVVTGVAETTRATKPSNTLLSSTTRTLPSGHIFVMEEDFACPKARSRGELCKNCRTCGTNQRARGTNPKAAGASIATMPGPVPPTETEIAAARLPNGRFRAQDLSRWGVPVPPPPSWHADLVQWSHRYHVEGRTVPPSTAEEIRDGASCPKCLAAPSMVCRDEYRRRLADGANHKARATAFHGRSPRPTREQIRAVSCPNCGAAPGTLCDRVNAMGPRKSSHIERVNAYDRLHRC
jgi:hypothetical protein